MKIRKAQKIDYFDIFSLIYNELGYKSCNFNDLVARIKMMSLDKNYHIFVALDEDKVVGFIGLMQNILFEFNGICMRVLAIAVKNEFQNNGIGKSLLEYAEKFAISNNIDLFMVGSGMEREDAHRFYEKNRFTKSSYGFWKLLK